MRFNIPPPLDPDDFDIEVDDSDDHADPLGLGHVCRSEFERGQLANDFVIAVTPRWLNYAVSEVLRGRTPATQVYLSPVLTGGPDLDLGHGPVARPMQFGGDYCRPARDGSCCAEVDPAVLPLHESLAPAPRLPRSGDVEVVVYDDFDDGLAWPMWCPRVGGVA